MNDNGEIYHGMDAQSSYLLTVSEDGTHTLMVRGHTKMTWSDPVALEPLSEAPC